MKNTDAIVVKLVTVLIYSTLTFLVLSFATVLLLPLILDPNNYKAQIASVVLERTGRNLTLDGKIHLELFPELTITLENISLANASGFGEKPMVTIQRLHGKLQLMQLFSNPLPIDELSATGVHINLDRNAAGENNWNDLVAHTITTADADILSKPIDLPDKYPGPRISIAQLGAITLATLSARGITLKESEVHYCEQHTKNSTVSCSHATHLEVIPNREKSDQPIAVTLRTELTTQNPPFSGHVALSAHHQPSRSEPLGGQWRDTRITIRGHIDMSPIKELELTWYSDVAMEPWSNSVRTMQTNSTLTVWSDTSLFRKFILSLQGKLEADLNTGRFRMPEGGMAWQVQADYLPPAGVKLAFQSAIEADWHMETIQMEQLRATGPAHLRMEGQLRASNLLSRPSLDAQLTAFHPDPRALLTALGRQVPPTTDPKAIAHAEVAATIHMDTEQLAVTDMILDVDASHFTGAFRLNTGMIVGSDKPVVRFDLQGDNLDLNSYLPPDLTTKEQTGRIALIAAAPEIFLPSIPAHMLHNMDIQGKVRLKQLRAANSQATDVSLDIGIKEGALHLQPYQLTLYNGHIKTHAHWDVRGNEPLLTVDKNITKMPLRPLLQRLQNTKPKSVRWRGSADLSSRLSSHGQQPDTLKKNLQGSLKLTVRDGSIQGIDVVEQIRKSYRSIMEHRPPKTNVIKKGTTHFSKLTATGTVRNGIVKNKDLLIISPSLKVTGKGQIDLMRPFVNFLLEADVATSLQGISMQNPDILHGMVLPMRIQGNFDALNPPSINTMDFLRMLRTAITTPIVQKGVVPSRKKQKVLEKIRKFKLKLRDRDKEAVNDILKQLLGIGH